LLKFFAVSTTKQPAWTGKFIDCQQNLAHLSLNGASSDQLPFFYFLLRSETDVSACSIQLSC
jgi:hypothetical protein